MNCGRQIKALIAAGALAASSPGVAQSNLTGAQLNAAGDRAYAAKNYAASIRYFRMAIDKGNADAANSLALQYFNARGVAHDTAMAVRLWTTAADGGNVEAMTTLGYMYFGGEIPQNLPLARKWGEAAAQRNSGAALAMLGAMHEDGVGLPKDRCAALRFYRRADAAGYKAMDAHIGLIYAAGQCGPTNWPLARQYFAEPAKNGDRLAIVSLRILDRLERENAASAYRGAIMAGMRTFVESMSSSSSSDTSSADNARFDMWRQNNRAQGLNDNGTQK